LDCLLYNKTIEDQIIKNEFVEVENLINKTILKQESIDDKSIPNIIFKKDIIVNECNSIKSNCLKLKTIKETSNIFNKCLNILITQSDVLSKKIDAVHHETNNPQDAAHFAEDNLIPLMNTIREASDSIELSMPAHRWPLPSYHEMMFHQD